MAKITLIGAGSVVFTPTCPAISFDPGLQGSTIALMDIDPQRLDIPPSWCRKLSTCATLRKVEATLDRREALAGADYVITTIQVGGVGGLRARHQHPAQIRRRPVRGRHASARAACFAGCAPSCAARHLQRYWTNCVRPVPCSST
jgi:alpha-galactosidase